MFRQTYRSIGSQIQSQRSQSSKESELVNEKTLRRKAMNLLNRPKLRKMEKNLKNGIIKPLRLAEQLRSHYLPESVEEKRCFEIDFDWLDNCDQQKFRMIFKEDLSKIQDLEMYIDENQEQLFHIFAQCACAKCTCNKCVCPFKKQDLQYGFGMVTSNRFDYQQKQPAYGTPIINMSHYDNIRHSNAIMQFNTTQRDNYRWQDTHHKKHRKSHSLHMQEKMAFGKTQNNLSLIDWKTYEGNEIFKAPVHKSTVGGQLMGTTSYRNQFVWKVNQNQEQPKQIPNQTFYRLYDNPMRTTYQQAYLGDKYPKVQNFKVPEIYQPKTAFLGQFLSIAQQDYTQKKLDDTQIQQKEWKSKLLNKLLQFK